MAEYEFKCGKCNHSFTLTQSMTSPRPKACPKCRARKDFGVVIQAPIGLRGEPRTVGALAERNSTRLGKEALELKLNSNAPKLSQAMQNRVESMGGVVKDRKKPSGEIPWYRDGSVPGIERSDKPLDLSKIVDVDKFVNTGDKR